MAEPEDGLVIAFCEIKLVDPVDNEVAIGIPGELAIRGPTVFSGYWQAQEFAAAGFTWAMCFAATTTARSTSSIAPNT